LLKFTQDLIYPIVTLWNENSNRRERIRRLLAFAGWQLWKRTVRKPITVTLFNGQRFAAYPGCPVSSGVLYTRIPNSKNILFVREHLSGGTLVDVGANVGSITLLLADKIENAILFEPNAVAAARARQNLSRNQLDFKVYELALSDTNGEIHFECNGAVDVGAHVVVNSSIIKPTSKIVQCITFDEFVRGHVDLRFPVSFVKIDVEGHENSVLRGMRQFLSQKRPALVMFEYLQRTNLDETIGIFAEIKYQVFELGANGPIMVAGHVEPLQDLFACPYERMTEMGLVALPS
jgi:FkbM family methyltransferase